MKKQVVLTTETISIDDTKESCFFGYTKKVTHGTDIGFLTQDLSNRFIAVSPERYYVTDTDYFTDAIKALIETDHKVYQFDSRAELFAWMAEEMKNTNN